jgi:hypothetical protein
VKRRQVIVRLGTGNVPPETVSNIQSIAAMLTSALNVAEAHYSADWDVEVIDCGLEEDGKEPA